MSNRRILTGVVESAKMTKTVIVSVDAIKVHPKYHKRYTVTKKYPTHNEIADLKVGDKVEIGECKPVSKTVHFEVIKKV